MAEVIRITLRYYNFLRLRLSSVNMLTTNEEKNDEVSENTIQRIISCLLHWLSCDLTYFDKKVMIIILHVCQDGFARS